MKVIEKEKVSNIEIAIHQEVAFQTDSRRKIFYKYYNRSDEEEHISLNNWKVSTIYYPNPKILQYPSRPSSQCSLI